MRAVLYLRSSKDRNDVSIDAQRRALVEFAAARGFVVVGEFADAVESGKDDDRPGFQSLIGALRQSGRAWDHVLALDTSRIARRRALAIIFEEQECKRRGVRVVYKSLPESDPITEMLLKSILQAMDEWHSLTSRVKGLSGMAENVRQGWRAGGRAPRGYRLESVETGAVRDGAPVTKTRLVPADDAPLIGAYLKARARGVGRAAAARAAGLSGVATTSLIDVDRNALVYAGATVWNRHAERDGSGYVGGAKLRPRSQWVVQKETHQALISEAEAEAILKLVEGGRRREAKTGARVYALSGLLVSPDGASWSGDSGFYRLGKGARISAEAVESGVVEQIIADFSSGVMVDAIAMHYRRIAEAPDDTAKEAAALRRQIAESEKRIGRLTELLAQTSAPEALLRQIEALEAERRGAAEALASLDSRKSLRAVSAAGVRAMLDGVSKALQSAPPEALRDMLRAIVAQVTLDPATWDAVVSYRIAPAVKAGSSWRPHGDSCVTPVFTHDSTVRIRHNRRAA